MKRKTFFKGVFLTGIRISDVVKYVLLQQEILSMGRLWHVLKKEMDACCASFKDSFALIERDCI